MEKNKRDGDAGEPPALRQKTQMVKSTIATLNCVQMRFVEGSGCGTEENNVILSPTIAQAARLRFRIETYTNQLLIPYPI